MGRLKKNFSANIYSLVVGIVGQLSIVPIYLHFWGTELYGAWLVLFTIPTLFMFTDAGLASAVGNEVSLCVERGHSDRAEAVFNAAWKYQTVIFLALFVFLVGLVWTFQVDRWLGVRGIPGSEFRAAIIFLAAGTYFELQRGLLSSLFRGAHRYHQYVAWSCHATLAEYLTTVAVLTIGGGIAAVSATMLFVKFLKVGVMFLGARKMLPQVQPRASAGQWRDFRALLPTAVSYFSFPVANAIINQGSVLAINILIGPSSVVLLSVSRQLARLFQRGTALLTASLHPEMTVALGRSDRKRVIELQAIAVTAVISAAFIFIPIATIFGPTLIDIWTQQNLGVTNILVGACAIEAVAFGAQGLFGLVPWASNRVSKLSVIYVSGNVIALLFSVLLFNSFGIEILPMAFGCFSVMYCAYALQFASTLEGFGVMETFKFSALWKSICRVNK